MPPLSIPLTSVLRAEVIAKGKVTAAGSNIKNFAFVFHYRRLSTANPPSKVDLEAIFQSTVMAVIAAGLNIRFTQVSNSVRWIDDLYDQALETPRTLPGLVAGDSMPTTASAFLLFRTGLKGKSFRGGKHLGPLSEADTTTLSDDIFNAAALVRIGNIRTAMLTTLVDATPNSWVPVVFSKTMSIMDTQPTQPVTTDVNAILINKRVSSLARRKAASVY